MLKTSKLDYLSGNFLRLKKNNKVVKILEKSIKRFATFSIEPQATEFSVLINQIAGFYEFLTVDFENSYGTIPI